MPKKMSFAHLFGRASAEDEEDRREDAEEEEDKKARKAKKGKAEEDNDDPDAEDDDNPDAEDGDDDPDAEEDDDDTGANDGDDDEERKDVKKGRRAERQRCARIFGSRHAAANPALAASLAFQTGMSSSAAIQVMASSGLPAVAKKTRAAAPITLDKRMAALKNHQLGNDVKSADASTPKGLAGAMTSLYNKTRGNK